jgi:arsenate reductase
MPGAAGNQCGNACRAIDGFYLRRNDCDNVRSVLSLKENKSMPVTIYGIKNCDTMKKARAWLDKKRVAYAFHDYKTAGIERAKLEGWAKKAGWETLLNRAGTTFRKLPDKDKDGITEKKAIALMLAQPSMIKRPVLELGGGKLLVGFKPDEYASAVKR